MMRILPRLSWLLLAPIVFCACGPEGSSPTTLSSTTSAPSRSTGGNETIDETVCPSAADAEEIVTYFSVPVAARGELDSSGFALSFTNALDEVVTRVEDDIDSTPCIGFDELFAMVQEWSDLTIEITESDEVALPDDQELQDIADLGNEWLVAIERDDLRFSLEADPANIGN
ncbi:hypothetical protein [Brevibacterium linens]|uniref:hypothetical protein n=1 Tax=Brevibacterium linens TaxID=1703 RepID=UPI0015E0A9E7|nr:hypothetical protein [Brevibacterium linens]